MRKFIMSILLPVMFLSLTSCSSPDGYDTTFDNLVARIDSLHDCADNVSTINIMVWQEVGPEYVSMYLNDIMVANIDDSGIIYSTMYKIFDTYDKSKLETYFELYCNSCNALSNDIASLKSDIKKLIDSYGKDHSAAVSALQDYFTKLESYANFALNPSGNLINYSANHGAYENEMQELKSTAEFEK